MTNASESTGVVCDCGPREFNLAAWWRVGVGLLIAANSMTLSLAINTSEATLPEQRMVHTVLFALALLSLVILGWPLAKNAARAAAERRITIEAMFLTGIVGALAGSSTAAITGTGDSYFEIVTIMLVVYAFGQQLTGQVQQRALRAAVDWAPELGRALVLDDDGRLVETPVSELGVGSLIVVPPGQLVSADGVVEAGEAFVREAELTGEPFVTVKRAGDTVWAGTHCVDAALRIRTTSEGSGRRIDRILGAVDSARSVPSTLQAQADRLVACFLPVVLVMAGLTLIGWTWLEGWEAGLFNAMAVLLVACPCALGLATPLALWVAVARLASRGLVVVSGDAVEALSQVTAVVFDKTGTLTEPRTRLVDMVVAPPEGMSGRQLLAMVESVQRVSHHPVSEAFSGLAQGVVEPWVVAELEILPGTGVQAVVAGTGVDRRSFTIVIGAADRLDLQEDHSWSLLRDRLEGEPTAREIAVVIDGLAVAAAQVDESLHSSWPDALETLRREKFHTAVLTGDSGERARHIGADEVAAGLGPEEKLARVEGWRADGVRVLFVGDGLNDAAAMAASDVSIAVAAGSDLASEVADIVWHGEDLRSIPWALELSGSTVKTIRSNLILAAGYNTVGIALAVAGVLHPVAAALLMTCSSVVVTWRATGGLQQDQREAESRVAVRSGTTAVTGETVGEVMG